MKNNKEGTKEKRYYWRNLASFIPVIKMTKQKIYNVWKCNFIGMNINKYSLWICSLGANEYEHGC